MKKYLSLIVIAILFVGCDSANDLGTPFTKGQEVTLTAAIGEQRPQMLPGKQRVSGINAGEEINLTWDEGDKILIKVGDQSAEFTLSDGAGTGEGTFTGIMPADGTSFHVEYPINYSDDVLKEQTYAPNGFGKGLMKMSTKTASTLNNGFTLSADNALLGLQLTGNQDLGKIILKDLSGEQTYTLNCEEKLKENEATIFYIVVPVEGWENGMLVEVYDKDGVVILRKEKKGKMDLKTTEAMIMPTLEARGPGKRIGVFSVGEGKYVSFSQGNLQYIQSTKTWQFAENQWEYIGEKNLKDGTLADKIDLFGWSSDNVATAFGISTSMNKADYQGNFVDWGVNWICCDALNSWRTLSKEEWDYLISRRPNAEQLRTKGSVNGMGGVILLPDNWICPTGYSIAKVNDNENLQLDVNNYSQADWSILEDGGAIILPAAGVRYENGALLVQDTNIFGGYWTCTSKDMQQSYCYNFHIQNCSYVDYSYHEYGRSVRLVHDTIQQN